MDDQKNNMEKGKGLEEIRKQLSREEDRFPVESHYFDGFSEKVMGRRAVTDKKKPFVPYIRFAAGFAAAASIVLVFFLFVKPNNQEETVLINRAEDAGFIQNDSEDLAELTVFSDSQALKLYAEETILPVTDVMMLTEALEQEPGLEDLGVAEMEEYLFENVELTEL